MREQHLDSAFDYKLASLRANNQLRIVSLVEKFEKVISKYTIGSLHLKSKAKKTKDTDKRAKYIKKSSKKLNKKQEKMAKKLMENIEKIQKNNKAIMEEKAKNGLIKRTRTVDFQRKLDACIINVKRWKAQLKTLKAQRAELLQKGEKMKVSKKRRDQNVVSEKTIVIHVHNKGGKKKVTMNLQQNGEMILKINKDLLECASTIQANGQIIARRQQVYRHHISRQVTCSAEKDRTTKVITGKMGTYKSMEKKFKSVKKFLDNRYKDLKKGKSKNAEGVLKEEKIIDSYIRDIKFKRWSLKWSIKAINSGSCELM